MIINNFVIDHVKRGLMLSTTDGSVLWSINQITNPSLNITTESVDAVDALGVPIASFNRAKTAEFSAENALFDLSLLAAMSGTNVDESTAANSYNIPIFDEVKCATANTITLSHTPATVGSASTLKYIYKMNGDGTLGSKFTVGDSTSAGVVTVSGTTVTFNTGEAVVGDRFFAQYEYTVNATSGTQASRVSVSANDFPKAGRFLMEVLGCDVCDQTKVIAAYVEFPVAKLQADMDYTFATDSTMSFTIRAQQDYCDADKLLYRIIIPD